MPEVVIDGKTGILTEPGETQSYADAIKDLLTDREKRQAMAENARAFVIEERSLRKAASTLDRILQDARGNAP